MPGAASTPREAKPEAKPEAAPAGWHPVGEQPATAAGSPVATGLRFVLHLVVGFLAGALVVGLAATVATLATGGRVALLEIRGLPIFLAGVVAIVVFAFLETSGRQAAGRWMAGRTLLGFVLLVGAVVLAFQPAVMGDMQRRLDRTTGVFGDQDTQAAEAFMARVDEWNAEVSRYRDEVVSGYVEDLAGVGDTEVDDPAEALAAIEARFRDETASSEETLSGILASMRSHAGEAEFQPLGEGLMDLADIYGDQLEGVRLVNRGFIEREQPDVARGDELFKDGVQRAVAYVDARLADILARGPVDAEAFRAAVARLEV